MKYHKIFLMFSLIIFLFSSSYFVLATPIWNYSSSYLGQNTSIILEGNPVYIYSMWSDDVAIDWVWIETNETGSWSNASYSFNYEDDTEDTWSSTGSWSTNHPNSSAVDENWSTYCFPSIGEVTQYIYENYTVPSNTIAANFTIKFKAEEPQPPPGLCINTTYYWDGNSWSSLNCTGLQVSLTTKTVPIPLDGINSEKLQLRTRTWNATGIIFGDGNWKYYEGKVIWYSNYIDMHDNGNWTWSNFTWQNDSITSGKICWRIYANDTSGNENVTNMNCFTIDSSSPFYSLNSTNSTIAGQPTEFRLKWNDNFDLSGYIFQFCNGTWNGTSCLSGLQNDTWNSFSTGGTEDWSNTTKTINSTVGAKIAWCYYSNDSVGNWNGTSCSDPFSMSPFTLITTGNSPPDKPIINSPGNGTTIATSNPSLNVTVTDPDGDNMNVSFYTVFSGYCYQETANESHGSDGSCYLEYSGSYAVNGNWSDTYPFSNTFDGSWSSAAFAEQNEDTYVYINYTKPIGALSTSKWKVRDDNTVNLSIPSLCFNYDSSKLILRVNSHSSGGADGYVSWDCYNGSWDSLRLYSSSYFIHEEGIYWNITNKIGNTQTNITNGSTAQVTWSDLSPGVAYEWYAVSGDGQTTNQSDTWTFNVDIYPSQYSNNSTNSTIAGQPTKFSISIRDQDGLDCAFYSIDNCTGSFVNQSWDCKLFDEYNRPTDWLNTTETINPENAVDDGYNDTTTYAKTFATGVNMSEITYIYELTNETQNANLFYTYKCTSEEPLSVPSDFMIYNYTSNSWKIYGTSLDQTSPTTIMRYVNTTSGLIANNGSVKITFSQQHEYLDCNIYIYDTYIYISDDINPSYTWFNETYSISDSYGCQVRWKVYANDTLGSMGNSSVYYFTTESATTTTSTSTSTSTTTSSTTTSTTTTTTIDYPPNYYNESISVLSNTQYNPSLIYQFNLTWQDNVAVDVVILEHNLTGSPSPHNETITTHNGDEYYFDTPNLAADTYVYKWYANDTSDNWNGTFPQTQYVVQKNQTNPVDIYLNNGTVYKNQNITITYGTETVANVTEIYQNSGSTALHRDGSSVSNPETITLPGGYYDYKGNITGNENYTDNSTGATHSITVNQATPSCSLDSTNGWEYTYESSTTLTCTCSGDGTSHLYFNGLEKDEYNDTSITFAASESGHEVICNTTATENYTAASDSNTLVIHKKDPSLGLVSNCTWSGTEYENICNQTGYVSSGDNSATKVLYRNYSPVSNSEIIKLGFGSYEYNYTYEESENYTFKNITNILIINKKNVNVILYPQNQTITYGDSINQYCSDNSTLIDCVIYRNETELTNNTNLVLGGGVHQYKANISDSENYTNYENISILTINKSTLNLSFSGNGTWTYPHQSEFNAIENNEGDSDVTYEIWRNNILVDNSTEYWDNVTLGVGEYLYRFNSTGGENWTENSTGITTFVNITQNSSTYNFINLTINGTEGDREYEINNLINISGYFDSSNFLGSDPTFTLYNNTSSIGATNPIEILLNYSSPVIVKFVYNTSGNVNYSSASKSYVLEVLDNSTPLYSKNQDDSEGSLDSGSIVNISVYWQDLGSLDKVTFYQNSTGNMIYNGTCDLSGNLSGWCNKTINTSGMSGETICWKQYANDTSNNLNNTMGNSSSCFYVEFLPVNIQISSPQNTTYNSLPIDFNVTTSDSSSWCGWNLNGTSNSSMNGSGSTWWDSINCSLGSNHLFVYCNNTDGTEMSINNTIYFTYESTTTTTTTTTVSSGGSGGGGGTTIVETTTTIIQDTNQEATNDTLTISNINLKENETKDTDVVSEWKDNIYRIGLKSNSNTTEGEIKIKLIEPNETDNNTKTYKQFEIESKNTTGIEEIVFYVSINKTWINENSVGNISFLSESNGNWSQLNYEYNSENEESISYKISLKNDTRSVRILGNRVIGQTVGNITKTETSGEVEMPNRRTIYILIAASGLIGSIIFVFVFFEKKRIKKITKIKEIKSNPKKYKGKRVKLDVKIKYSDYSHKHKKFGYKIKDKTGTIKGYSEKIEKDKGTIVARVNKDEKELYLNF